MIGNILKPAVRKGPDYHLMRIRLIRIFIWKNGIDRQFDCPILFFLITYDFRVREIGIPQFIKSSRSVFIRLFLW